MRKTRRIGASILAIGFLVVVPSAADASPRTALCVGTTTLGPPMNYSSAGGQGVTVERWDFTGVQDLCLVDGTVVEATMEGDLILVTREDGTGRVAVRYSLEIPNGTLDGVVTTKFSPTSFDARVHAFGGTGVLSGMSGHGTTQMTGPNTFADEIVYRYA